MIAYTSTPSPDVGNVRQCEGLGDCMQRIVRYLIAGASAAIIFPALCLAQFGSIAGIVKDSTGAVVPNVSVEAANPDSIEGARTAVSDTSGQYRIEQLIPGT